MRQSLGFYLNSKLLDDNELVTDERDRESCVLASLNDTHDSEYKASKTNYCRSDVADNRDNIQDAACNANDRENDTVVNVVLYIRYILLRCLEQTDEPKDTDVRKDSECLLGTCGSTEYCFGLCCVHRRIVELFIIFHNSPSKK